MIVRRLLAICNVFLCIVNGYRISSRCSRCRKLQGGESDLFNCSSYGSDIIDRKENTVTVNLTVDIADLKFEWLEIKRRLYNGKMCGPTIRVRKGDILIINLKNNLGPNTMPGVNNELRQPNTTNFVIHGLHVSPMDNDANVLDFVVVNPNQSHQYKYEIKSDQPAGTYWYHAGWHGSSWFQVMSGMSGMLIVEDAGKNQILELFSCPSHCENDIHILLQSTLQYVDNVDGVSFISQIQDKIGDKFRLNSDEEAWLMNKTNNFNHYTANGNYKPVLDINKNEMKRFRIVNAGGYDSLELEVVDLNDTSHKPCTINEISVDGLYLNTPRDQQQMGQSFLPPGGRVDWLIFCHRHGKFLLRSYPYKINDYSVGKVRRFNGTLVMLNVHDTHDPEPSFPRALPERPAYVHDLSDDEPDKKFTVELADDFYINRRLFSNSSNYMFNMTVEAVQEWTFVNTNYEESYPIHIDVNQFQIISYNAYNGPISGKSQCYFPEFKTFVFRAQNNNLCNDTYAIPTLGNEKAITWNWDKGYLDHMKRWEELTNHDTINSGLVGYVQKGEWRDVLNLPPLASVTVRFVTDSFKGTMVVNSQVLKHKDMGMMMITQVSDDAITNNPIQLGCHEIKQFEQKSFIQSYWWAILIIVCIAAIGFVIVTCKDKAILQRSSCCLKQKPEDRNPFIDQENNVGNVPASKENDYEAINHGPDPGHPVEVDRFYEPEAFSA